MIKEIRNRFLLLSKDGTKVLGRHPTKAKAQAQARAIGARKTSKNNPNRIV